MINITRTIIISAALFISSLNLFSQKIKSDGFTCTLKEIHKENLRTCGNTNVVFLEFDTSEGYLS